MTTLPQPSWPIHTYDEAVAVLVELWEANAAAEPDAGRYVLFVHSGDDQLDPTPGLAVTVGNSTRYFMGSHDRDGKPLRADLRMTRKLFKSARRAAGGGMFVIERTDGKSFWLEWVGGSASV